MKNAIALLSLMIWTVPLIAAEQTVTAKIRSFDAKKNSLKLDDHELDVTRKTKVTIDGKKGSLADLKSGQQVKVIYDDSLEAAISIAIGETGEDDDGASTAKTMKELQGEWLCIAMEEGGKTLDKKSVKAQDRRVTIKGHSYTMEQTIGGKRGAYSGKFEIDASNGDFDWIGKGPAGAPNEWIGLYELDGDTLKVCFRFKRTGDAERPKKFKTDDSKQNLAVFYTFKRETE